MEHAPLETCSITSQGNVPPADPRIVDVAILDMHLGYASLGLDAIVATITRAVAFLAPGLVDGLRVRILSYDIRRSGVLPSTPGERHLLYIGSGGPGHLDPRENDGLREWSQGVREDPTWEAPLFRLFDAIRDHEDAALLGICHTYGLLCRWSNLAEPVLRETKSVGVVSTALTKEAAAHPWLARMIPPQSLSVVDNRLFDLRLIPGALPHGVVILGVSPTDAANAALTMVEFARDAGGVMPRVLGMNHHPEIDDARHQMSLIEEKVARGDVTEAWAHDRRRTMQSVFKDVETARMVREASMLTFQGPLRFHLAKALRIRRAALGLSPTIDEGEVLAELTKELLAGRMR